MTLTTIIGTVDAFSFSIGGNPYFNSAYRFKNKNACITVKSATQLPDYGETSVEIHEHDIKKNKWKRRDLFGKSIVEQTMEELKNNKEFQETSKRIGEIGLKGMTREERTKRRRALDSLGVPSFNQFLAEQNSADEEKDSKPPLILNRKDPEVLQLNIGLYCNQGMFIPKYEKSEVIRFCC